MDLIVYVGNKFLKTVGVSYSSHLVKSVDYLKQENNRDMLGNGENHCKLDRHRARLLHKLILKRH